MATTGYLFLLELVPKKNETRVATLFFFFDQMPYLMTVIYFWVISKLWFWIVLVGYVMQIISMILYWFLPESPAFLFSLNRVDETIQVF